MENILLHLRVFLWTYEPEYARNYPGFHLAAVPDSCSALANWLEQHRSSELGIRRTIPLTPLRAGRVPPVSGKLPCRYFIKLKLTLRPSADDLPEMVIHSECDRVSLEISHSKLPELIQGLRDIENGNGDYAISAKSPSDRVVHQLWFWPCHGEYWAKD